MSNDSSICGAGRVAALLLVMAAFLGGSSQAWGTTLTLQPGEATSEDVFAYEFLASTNLDNYTLGKLNFGQLLAVTTTDGSGHDIKSLIRFDLAGNNLVYPGQVQSATLKLRVTDATTVGFPVANPSASFSVNVDAYPATSAWSETKVNWNTLPSAGTELAATAKISAINQTVSFALTDAVRDWVAAPASNFGLLLEQRNSVFNSNAGMYVGVVFSASAAASNRPALEITLAPQMPGDANFDGLVDGADYTIWADNYLLTGALFTQGDFTGDGTVDGADYTIWADNYAPALAALAVVPEPGTLALAAVGLPALAGWMIAARRRAAR
ncbi:MAG: DNRLRE domain-containing protein [Planctomycetaceae bacterium]|nr:DNRLRE domain-containing protein [Planctomycetaceae bacterium]